ncbi:MAG: MFS transporter [Eubacterium sp.]|nr:MFS transporter [Eubacterium sp.]
MSKVFSSLSGKARDFIATGKKYWNEPAKGNYVPYKEVVNLGAAGFGVHWTSTLPSTIGLDASNFLVGASIGLRPIDLSIMLIVANIIGIPLTFFRSWYFDNHHMKGGKFLPFLLRTPFPIVAISTFFVWLPFESFEYTVKAAVVFTFYMIVQFFLSFYNEGWAYLQQIITPNAQERANVMSISQIIYSLAPTLSNLIIPTIAGLTFGLNNIQTYRIIYPVFSFIGIIINTIFFRRIKERLILPKRKMANIRIIDAIREVSKNKYFWITNGAGWIGFLEGAYGVLLGWSFVYAYNGEKQAQLGLVNTILGNAALWSMILCPFAIKLMGKRNLLILHNSLNVVFFVIMFFCYKNLLALCVILFFNGFINTFQNIYFPGIQADMKDYHQWKTGVRIDGLFKPLELIGTVLGFFTGLVLPTIYERMGLHDDYNVLYDDTLRNNLFQVLIICSIIGAILNLIPFFFYDLTENKHDGYVYVLKIRAMFEDYGNGDISDDELVEAMEIINRARTLEGKEKQPVDKTALHNARSMPKRDEYDKQLRKEAIKKAKKEIKEAKKYNNDIESYAIVLDELNKFETEAYKIQLTAAKKTYAGGPLQSYSELYEEEALAKMLPNNTKEEKQIRSNAFNAIRTKRAAAKLVKKYGIENILPPDESKREEIQNRETPTIADTMRAKRDLKAFLKAESIYNRATAPYDNARNILIQSENYTHLAEIEELYASILEKQSTVSVQ